jgi:hypothetical protein
MLEITTPAASNDLTDLARVKTELGITTTAEDAKLAILISEASDLITAYCNRDTLRRETLRQTERISSPRECIILDRDLAVSITSVTVNGDALTASDYELDGSLLYRLDDDTRVEWTDEKAVIVYAAGFNALSDVPDAISRAAVDIVVNLYRSAGRDTSIRTEMVEGVGSTSYTDLRANSGLPLSAERIQALTRYRLIVAA